MPAEPDDIIAVRDPDAADFFNLRCQLQQVVELGSPQVLQTHFRYYEKEAAVLYLAIALPLGPQEFDTPAFEVIDVLGVVNSALTVGLVVLDPEFESVLP